MNDSLNRLRDADPARDLPALPEHWRTREEIIMRHTPETNIVPPLPHHGRWVDAVALGALALAVVGVVFTQSDATVLPKITAPAEFARDGAATNLGAMAPVRYVLADGADIPGGHRVAWRWEAPSTDAVRRLAESLGISGTLVTRPAAEGGGWSIEGADDTLSVDAHGQWWFGSVSSGVSRCIVVDPAVLPSPDGVVPPQAPSKTGDSQVSPGSSGSGSSGGSAGSGVDAETGVVSDASVSECANTDLPTLSTQEIGLEDLMTLARTIAPDAAIRANDNGVMVEIAYQIDEADSGVTGIVQSMDGHVVASGILGHPVRVGEYPTISAAAALERLNASVGPLVCGAPTGVFCGEPTSSGMTSTGTTSAPSDAPAPAEAVVEIRDVRAALVAYVDAAGQMWSLPGYLYRLDGGSTLNVQAVDNELFAPPSPVVAPPPLTSDHGSTEPTPPPVTAEDPGVIGEVIVAEVVGLREDEAIKVIESAGLHARVVSRDGVSYAVTDDYTTSRINLGIEAGVVRKASIG